MSSTINIEDTEAIQIVQAIKSKEDFKISVEEDASYDFSRTREFPDVPLDNASGKENQTRGFLSCNDSRCRNQLLRLQ